MAVAEGIYKDRGSKFLAFAEPIKDEDEAKTRIAWYKKATPIVWVRTYGVPRTTANRTAQPELLS